MVKFVYFDVGGVLIDDFSGNNKWQEMKSAIGVKPEIDKELDGVYDKYESEELCLTREVNSLMPILSERFGINFPDNFSMLNYFVTHFGTNIPIWPAVMKARENAGIGLLTNMYVGMLSEIVKKELLPLVSWDVVIDSTEVGFQKPDVEIYKLAEKRSGYSGKEILFIDNKQENIDVARNLGWNTFLYDSSNHARASRELVDYLKNIWKH